MKIDWDEVRRQHEIGTRYVLSQIGMDTPKLTPDPTLDGPDLNEKWCVYETECESCGKRIIHVATLHAYEFGYVEHQPFCMTCEMK